jgi:hypothetical protein
MSAPEPAWLLGQKDALGLSDVQVKKLRQMRARWDRDTRELEEALTRASAEFDREMGAAGKRGSTLENLKTRAAPVSELTRALLEARRAWWEEAARVLTETQREEAERAWRERLLPGSNQKQKESGRS